MYLISEISKNEAEGQLHPFFSFTKIHFSGLNEKSATESFAISIEQNIAIQNLHAGSPKKIF